MAKVPRGGSVPSSYSVTPDQLIGGEKYSRLYVYGGSQLHFFTKINPRKTKSWKKWATR